MKNLLNLLKYYLFAPPRWGKCRKASCWDGPNASRRMMNILSPHFSEAEYRRRVKWAENRRCNTLHLFLVNQHDGEGSGYRVTDQDTAKLMERRIVWARKRGMAIVLWILADDSNAWAREVFADPDATINAARPLLRHASTVVLGLEMDEYGSPQNWQRLKDALRRRYSGKIGTHHTSGHAGYAGMGDILFYQIAPGRDAEQVASATKAALAVGKPVNMFEIARSPARELAQAALDSGAFGVGNW
jgi:hypothetical protein